VIVRPADLTTPVTVCRPGSVAVHRAPVQDPSGLIEKVVRAVTSPSGRCSRSYPWTT
jgi:hypothetical protein